MAEIQSSINWTIILIVIVVLASFQAILAAFLFVAIRMTGKITRAIDVMTEYTNRLRKAPNVISKRRIIEEMSNDKTFADTSEFYDNMKLAKRALVHRYKQELARNGSDYRLTTTEAQDNDLQQKLLVETGRSRYTLTEDDEVPAEVKAIQAGSEMKLISEWTDMYDELDELKKIFFEFLKRWTDTERNDQLDPNRPVIYQVHKDVEEFKLSVPEARTSQFTQKRETKSFNQSRTSRNNYALRRRAQSPADMSIHPVEPQDVGARRANERLYTEDNQDSMAITPTKIGQVLNTEGNQTSKNASSRQSHYPSLQYSQSQQSMRRDLNSQVHPKQKYIRQELGRNFFAINEDRSIDELTENLIDESGNRRGSNM